MSKDLISDQIREAVAKNPGSLHALAADAGIHRSALTRFMAGESKLSLDSAAAVCKTLGLRLVAGRKPPRKR